MTRMMRQRLWGLTLVLICAAVLFAASSGVTDTERDIGAVWVLLPLGVYALTSRHYVLYDRRSSTRRTVRRQHRREDRKGVISWQENAL